MPVARTAFSLRVKAMLPKPLPPFLMTAVTSIPFLLPGLALAAEDNGLKPPPWHLIDIYGRQIPVEEIPKVTVTFGNLRVNGTPVEKPSATAVYPRRVPDYAEAVAKDGQLVVKVGEPVADRQRREVALLPVK
jgi:hypothetical protein